MPIVKIDRKAYYYWIDSKPVMFLGQVIMLATSQKYKSTEILPVCQWQLPVQDSFLYQDGYLEIDLQLNSGIRVHLHQSSESQKKKKKLKPILLFQASWKTTLNPCGLKKYF